MYKVLKAIIISATALQLWQIATPALAQDSASDAVQSWLTLDQDFRQAIVDEISVARGLDAKVQNPDLLVRSAKDIAEALAVSCGIAGTCASTIGQGEELEPPPGYTEEQGMKNAQAIHRMKMGVSGQ